MPTHLTCEALRCAPDVALADAAAMRAALVAAVRRAAATLVGEAAHAYHGGGGGVTAVVLCAESHILVSTWPEERYALVEVFLCGGNADPAAAAAAVRDALRPQEWRVHRAPVSAPTFGPTGAGAEG